MSLLISKIKDFKTKVCEELQINYQKINELLFEVGKIIE